MIPITEPRERGLQNVGSTKRIKGLAMVSRFIGLLAIVTLFSGCAGMNEQECLVTDWRTVGYEDGARGVSQTNVNATSLRRVLIPLPPIEYQLRTIAALRSLTDASDSARSRAAEAGRMITRFINAELTR